MASDDHWSYGVTTEFGIFNEETDYALKRRAIGGEVGYSTAELRYARRLEYREDSRALQDLGVWLMRSYISHKVNPDWRVLGKLDFSVGNSNRFDYFNGDFVVRKKGTDLFYEKRGQIYFRYSNF